MVKNLIVVGNWKMYKTAREAAGYVEELIPLIEGCSASVFLAVPFTSIATASKASKGTEMLIGAQNMNDAREGAFTGEIAALMLKEAGAEFVLIGHSERRRFFGETDALIQKKVMRALSDDLIPILCVGETLEEREAGQTEEVLRRQIEVALKEVPTEEVAKLILAYEPVWAIGTGKSATAQIAQEAHAICKDVLGEVFGKRKAALIPILYGGSVTEKNVTDLIAQKEIDGVLVGGSSLDPKTLSEIVLKCKKMKKKAKEE